MSLPAWLRRRRPASARARKRRETGGARLHLEPLEERSLLAVSVFASTQVPRAIPDQGEVLSRIVINRDLFIRDLNVTLDIQHTFADDVGAALVGPDGTRIELFAGIGGSEDDFHDTTLDDEALDNIAAGTAPFTGSFRPAEDRPNNHLFAFDGQNARGVWTLELNDLAQNDVGKLRSWSLSIDGGDTPPTETDVVLTEVNLEQASGFWGDELSLAYRLSNNGASATGPFAVALVVSTDAVIDATDLEVARFEIAGLAAGATVARIDVLRLPGTPLLAPDGFAIPDDVFIGLRVDAADVVAEYDEANVAARPFSILPKPVEIRGTVWQDDDGDGARDDTEPPLAGLFVALDSNSNGRFDPSEPTTTTAADGSYRFDRLPAGAYLVNVVPGPGLLQSFPTLVAGGELFRFDFEGGAAGFTSSGPSDAWHLSTGRSADEGRSPSSGFYFGNGETERGGGAYGNNADGTLLSPLLDLRDQVGPLQLTFRHFLRSEARFDFATVGVVVNGVETVLATNDSTLGAGLPADTNGFETVKLDLSPFAGEQIQLFFRFTSDASVVEEGWYVDDLSVVGVTHRGNFVFLATGETAEGLDFGLIPFADLIGTNLDVRASRLPFGAPVAVEYAVTNQGRLDAAPFRVAVYLSPDAVIDDTDFLLTILDVTGLNAGQSTAGTLMLALPATAPPGFEANTRAFVGLRIDSTDAVVELIETNNANVAGRRDRAGFALLRSFAESEPNDSQALADSVVVVSTVTGELANAADVDSFTFTLAESGLVSLTLEASAGAPLDPTLELLDAAGRTLVRSDDRAPGAPGAWIGQQLAAGTYTVRVADQQAGALAPRGYRLDVGFTATLASVETLATEGRPVAVARGDVDGDGQLDLVSVNQTANSVSVFLGNGDGTFRGAGAFAAGDFPDALALGDVDGDRRLDVVVTNFKSNTLTILAGNGDGSFQFAGTLVTGDSPSNIELADVNGDARLDIATSHVFSGYVSLYLNGPAGFQSELRHATIEGGLDLLLVDVNDDDRPDLLLSNFDGTLSVRLGNGDGSFQMERRYDIGDNPRTLRVGDLNEDGRLDVVTANSASDTLSLLRGNGDGTFQAAQTLFVGDGPIGLDLADMNRDGHLDLLASNVDNTLAVVLGDGTGQFEVRPRSSAGNSPDALLVADFNGDDLPDVVTADMDSDTLSLLPGNGDGSLQDRPRVAVNRGNAFAAGDLNGDGFIDLVAASFRTADVAVRLGRGDGTFQPQQRYPVENNVNDVVLADVNDDGRLDVLTGNGFDGVSVLLGNGDGTFQPSRLAEFSGVTQALAVADLDNDRRLDLIAAEFGGVNVLAGNGDGTFRAARTPIDVAARSLVAADFDADGLSDLALATDAGVTVHLGSGKRRFRAAESFSAGENVEPGWIASGDFNRDGRPDLVTANPATNDVSILLGRSQGRFAAPVRLAAGTEPGYVVVADANGDGRLDIFATNSVSDSVSVLLGNGDGSFQLERHFPTGDHPDTLAVADANLDGRPDLLVRNRFSSDVSVLLGDGTGTFIPFRPETTVNTRHTPHLIDLDGDGVRDSVVLNNVGTILFRRGLAGGSNQYASPISLNPERPARDLVVLHTLAGAAVAVCDKLGDSVSLYEFAGGSFGRSQTLSVGRLPGRLAVADLNDDGLDDLAVANVMDNTLSLIYQQPDGRALVRPAIPCGVTPIDIVFADMDGTAGLDVLVANRSSGDVTVLYKDAAHEFNRTERFRGGVGLSAFQESAGLLQPRSREELFALVVGPVNGDERPDVVSVNRGAHVFSVLMGTSSGGLVNPSQDFRFSTTSAGLINDRPGEIVADDFNGDGQLDVAILMEDRGEVWVYSGDGTGSFALANMVKAGNSPSGLALDDVNGDDVVDLVVGNDFGDVLFVLGNGDGTFRPFVRTDNRVSFVATDLDRNGTVDVVLADQARDAARSLSRDQLSASFTPGSFERDGGDGLIGPGDVTLADVDGRFGPDLIFANTGSNNVLIYLRQEGGGFADTAVSFFTGTSPVGLHVAQLNDDNRDGRIDGNDLLDLAVANQGSNDISVLLGTRNSDVNNDGVLDGVDLFRLGPRLSTGSFGPSFVSTQLMNGDAVPDLIAASASGANVTLLPGVGNGFFRDGAATTLNLTSPPVDLDSDFALLADGSIVQVDFTGLTTLFTAGARQPAAFAAVNLPGGAFPVFFTANSDGSVSALASRDGINYTEALNLPGDGVDSPSALAVLQQANAVEVYVSDASDAGLIVLRFGVEDLVTGLESVDGGSSLALVATLSNSLLVDTRPAPTVGGFDASTLLGVEEGATGVEVVDGVLVGVGQQILSGLEEELAGEEEPEPDEVAPITLQQFLVGLEESLRELGWDNRQQSGRKGEALLEMSRWLEQCGQTLTEAVQPYVILVQIIADSVPAPAHEPEEDIQANPVVEPPAPVAEVARTVAVPAGVAHRRAPLPALVSVGVLVAWLWWQPHRTAKKSRTVSV